MRDTRTLKSDGITANRFHRNNNTQWTTLLPKLLIFLEILVETFLRNNNINNWLVYKYVNPPPPVITQLGAFLSVCHTYYCSTF